VNLDNGPEPPIRLISILVGTMIGCILTYAYQVNLPSLFHETYLWASLVVFVAIPVMAGFVSGLLHPTMAMKNGLCVGFFSGLFNSILATVKLIYSPIVITMEVYAFSLFAVMSVFIWTILGAVSALLARRVYD